MLVLLGKYRKCRCTTNRQERLHEEIGHLIRIFPNVDSVYRRVGAPWLNRTGSGLSGARSTRMNSVSGG